MGADADLHLFDDRKYREEVMPAFVELLRDGTIAPWLAELMAHDVWVRGDFDVAALGRADLAEQCT